MNDVASDNGPQIKLLTLSEDHACSYLTEQKANSVFLDHDTPPTWQQYCQLTRIGFRRSGEHFYRPHCKQCDACLSCRVRATDINLSSKRFKRILNRNGQMHYSLVDASFSQEHYDLYEKYITQRHSDGDMFPPSVDQYKNFLTSHQHYSYFLEIRLDSKLVACCVTDALDDGLSAIYTYFDPEFEKSSPGTLAVLLLCKLAKEKSLPYVYLGYWVKNSQKMHYKIQFQPLEIFNGENWQSLPAQP